jgi:manganese transport system substrate-binding protein
VRLKVRYVFGMPKNLRRLGGRAAALGLATALATLLAACSTGGASGAGAADTAPDPDDDRPVVLTTFTVLADIAENVAAGHLRVESITKAGAEIHGYEPTPGDIRRAADADLILDNGLGLEAWFERFVQSVDAPHVVVSEGIDEIPIAEDAYQGEANPHAWMSPLNVQVYVENMVQAFTELDPEHAAEFEAAGTEYRGELQAVHDELVGALDGLPPEHRALVTCEGAFSYLARDAGLTERYIWAVNAEQQATPQQITGTIRFVESEGVPAVFCESTVSDAPMQQVVEATGAVFGGTLYVDSLSGPEGPVATYLDLIRHDVRTITAGLGGAAGGGASG